MIADIAAVLFYGIVILSLFALVIVGFHGSSEDERRRMADLWEDDSPPWQP